MNRTDRLLAMVLELQAKKTQRAEDLAATFEISKRTVYRDIQALSEAGVPIISVPGTGYSLMEDYFLPPLSFTADEATMLLLGLDVMTQSFDAEYRAAAQSSARKIAGVLPDAQRDKVAWLRESLHFISTDRATPTHAATLQTLRGALIKQQQVRFAYISRHSGEPTAETRTANPYGLVRVSDAWILVAYCHLRKDIRNFRLSRISDLTVLDAHFERPTDYMTRESTRRREEPRLIVHVWFDQEATPWVDEDRFYFIADRQPTDDGGLLVTLKLRQERDALQWLLGWGSHILRVDSPSLREMLAAEVQKMNSIYEK
ncbi:MAG: YafY family transcriptional regulator [Anaerolineae bacterium]|nr:YafY family transcriptional regulator [Anaerolineae bacterium]